MTHPLSLLLLVLCCVIAGARARADTGYPYQSCFEIASRLHHVPLDVLLAVAATESDWNPDARSAANAHGIMQIQWPETARHLGVTRVAELYNPCLNIELGARYLRELLDRNGGDLSRALAAYNYGPGRIEGRAALPPGAAGYVGRVDGQRRRILRRAAGEGIRRGDPGQGVMVFDDPARARRYAEALNARVESARFSSAQAEHGYAVSMQVDAAGLSFQDAVLLRTLGWPETTGDGQ